MTDSDLLKKVINPERYGYCPRCMNPYLKYGKDIRWEMGDPKYPALSRRDNKTLICSYCGEAEAFEDIGWSTWTGPVYWEEKPDDKG